MLLWRAPAISDNLQSTQRHRPGSHGRRACHRTATSTSTCLRALPCLGGTSHTSHTHHRVFSRGCSTDEACVTPAANQRQILPARSHRRLPQGCPRLDPPDRDIEDPACSPTKAAHCAATVPNPCLPGSPRPARSQDARRRPLGSAQPGSGRSPHRRPSASIPHAASQGLPAYLPRCPR